ncbi:DedA family protein [Candidatus Pantoea edessiphila]|uniref:DedA family protein n=1 Tax=Candidatus Pantoea edessiphila TaxID=2044610 RepID=A0A2P5SXS1_9GAMM|nr:DedA family protein [Candidatus Pantoea edessiphila]MBK4775740.1 DedA family protein [Pantoea sp. Edef]PPI87136.1 DedA family protein [Candidatus Pantoea edessiphila]
MNILQTLLHALWQKDYNTLSDPSIMWFLYGVLFVIIFLENGLLPAAFLPGDSLLILVGVLVGKGIVNFTLIIIILSTSAGLGYWISYMQGKWLGNTVIVQKWLSQLPNTYHQRAYSLFYRHGLAALLIGRFIAFVRTLLPTIAGMSGLNNIRFQFFNWISGLLWVSILVTIGFVLSQTKIFIHYEDKLMFVLILLPLILLFFGIISLLVVLYRKHKFNKNKIKNKL